MTVLLLLPIEDSASISEQFVRATTRAEAEHLAIAAELEISYEQAQEYAVKEVWDSIVFEGHLMQVEHD